METHDFLLVLQVPAAVAENPDSEATDNLANALYEASCDDGSLGMWCGRWELVLHREAERIDDAVRSAIEQVESTGCRVLGVESPDQRAFDRLNEELAAREKTGTAAGA